MMRKQRRGILIAGVLCTLGVSSALVLIAMRDQVVFFYSPSEILERVQEIGETRIRLGGMVESGSVKRGESAMSIRFSVTDTYKQLPVIYSGILPDLFREGQGVVAEGKLRADGIFKADVILAKHDESYMPREVADAIDEAKAKSETR